jgi:hypothetical protein
VDPATYQIMGNLKIVTTGLLLWACLRRQLSLLQWLALALLMIGATTSQVGGVSTFHVMGRACECMHLHGRSLPFWVRACTLTIPMVSETCWCCS